MMDENFCQSHSGVISKIENLEKSDVDQWSAINKLQNRLPVWATVIISILTFLLGLSIGYNSMQFG